MNRDQMQAKSNLEAAVTAYKDCGTKAMEMASKVAMAPELRALSAESLVGARAVLEGIADMFLQKAALLQEMIEEAVAAAPPSSGRH